MKKVKLIICVVTGTLAAITPAQAQAPQAGDAVPVTVKNFIRVAALTESLRSGKPDPGLGLRYRSLSVI